MPFRDHPLSLRQMLQAMAYIREFLGTYSLQELMHDRKTLAAIERELQIVTEAAFRLGDQAAILCPGPDWDNIRGFGNILRHAYDSILPERLWDILQIELPTLEAHVKAALDRIDRTDQPS